MPIYEEAHPGPRSLTFRPRPGETVALKITRPGAVAGQTLTVDQSVLTLKPGVRATDASLSLSLRSSRGDRQILTLPEGSDLLAARIDGAAQPLRLEGRRLTVPITPGAHTVDVDWRQPGGTRMFYRSPEATFGASLLNTGTYTLTVTNPDGQSRSSTFNIISACGGGARIATNNKPSSTELVRSNVEFKNSLNKVYPNPTNSMVYFEIESKIDQKVYVELFDMEGRRV